MFFALTLFTSAALLFAVQPMFAKMVLPLLGGAPAVWNTCLVFYQATLLVGYLYAHLSLAWLGPRRQAMLHLVLLCLPWLVLPIGVAENWLPPANAFPVPWLWMLLSVSVGLPFLLVSATAPMLQAWFSRTGSPSSRDPYFLYAASNLGSLLALLGYPLLIESQWTLGEQAWGWTAGYGLLMLLIAGCAVLLWRCSPATQPPSAVAQEAFDTASHLASPAALAGAVAGSFQPVVGRNDLYFHGHCRHPVAVGATAGVVSAELCVGFRPASRLLPLCGMLQAQPYLIVAAAAVVGLACRFADATGVDWLASAWWRFSSPPWSATASLPRTGRRKVT